MSWQIITGDCRAALDALDPRSVDTCVTSPPYFGLRDYGHDGQIGLESTPEAYVGELVAVFREVRRVLRDDGTLWLNLGDSYAATSKGTGGTGASGLMRDGRSENGRASADAANGRAKFTARRFEVGDGLKIKDLIGIPWMVAFALRADGWYLRSEIIWHKLNPMPESVKDRPTKAHETLFLLSKSPRYYYDAAMIREPAIQGLRQNGVMTSGLRNRRSVWAVPSAPYAGAHFATFPPKLIEPCILAGCPEGGTVLDPFAGAGTTGMVALRHGRSFVGVELSTEYAALARQRINDDSPLLNGAGELLA